MADEPVQAGSLVASDGNGGLDFTPEGLNSLLGMIEEAPTKQQEEVKAPLEKPGELEVAAESSTEPASEEPLAQPTETPQQEVARKLKLKVDGQELEVDEAHAISLAQMGAHYTREMQALRDKERQMAPYDALFQQLQRDPNLNQYISQYYQNQGKPETPPTFEDPIEQLKWETKQQTIKEIEDKYFKPLMQQRATEKQEAVIERTRNQVQRDPLFTQTHAEIERWVRTLPTKDMVTTVQKLDTDPNAYLAVYKQAREFVSKQPVTTPGKEAPVPPAPKEGTEHAPILEKPGNAPITASAEKKQAEKISKAKANALRSGDTDALADYLKVGGFIDHLL
jgi:hypothetical protein